MGCGAGSVPNGEENFDQCMGSLPTQHHEEFGWLQIYSSVPGLEPHVSPKLSSVPSWEEILDQCIGSLPTQHCEEL